MSKKPVFKQPVNNGSAPKKSTSKHSTSKQSTPKQSASKQEPNFTCTGLTPEARGLVSFMGKNHEVAGVLPQEVFQAQVIRRKTSQELRLTRIEKPSPDRVKAPCPYFGECGGCQLLHLSTQAQNQFKQDQAQKALGKFGKVAPLMTMDNPTRYRNKSHTTFGMTSKGQILAGIYAEGSHRLVSIDSCLMQTPKADQIAATIKGMLKSFKLLPFDEDSGQGLVRHVLINTAYATGEIMVVLVVANHVVPSKANFVKALIKAHPDVSTVVLNINAQRTSMVLGPYEHVLYGKGYIEDVLCGQRFRISSKSFYQINPLQTEKLYNEAIRMANLTGKERVIDAYCGIGTIGIVAAPKAKEVIGIEVNADAVDDAQMNAQLNGLNNMRFIQADAGRHMVKMAEKGQGVDVVFLDPPRAGSDTAFLTSLVRMAPKTVVYVSCNVQTLGRDLDYLTQNGYKVLEIQPVDMFPGTYHVETVVLMSRKDK